MHPSKTSIEREWQRRDLYRFSVAAWPYVVPAPFVAGIHIDLICRELERLARGETRRLLITLPPRFTKSTLASVMLPAWWWLHDPTTRFLTASYALDLATRDSLAMRRLVESPWYQRLAQGRIRLGDDQAAKARFENTLGGGRLATSVGGSVTGEGGDIVILDDPLRIDHAYSQAAREAAIDWFTSVLLTRLNDPQTARILVIGQRVHEYDLPGYLIDTGGWTHLCLPAEYDPTHPFLYPGDPRTTPGQLLWPQRWSHDLLDAQKRELGATTAASLLQQLPVPQTGAIIDQRWWRYYPATANLPPFTAILQSWDLTFGDSPGADYVVGQAWGLVGADRYLLHQIRRQLSFTATIAAVGELTEWVNHHYPQHRGHAILVEQAANGAAVIDTLHKEIPAIIAVPPQGDKIQRAHAVSHQIESGNVYLPGAPNHDHTSYDPAATPPWVREFIEEVSRFPRGRYDDQVDALTQALLRAETHAFRTSVSGPANLPSRRPITAASMIRHQPLSSLSRRDQTFAQRLLAAGYQPQRSYPSLEPPADSNAAAGEADAGFAVADAGDGEPGSEER